MMENDRGGTPAAHEGPTDDQVWPAFEQGLATYLRTMVDPSEGDHLLVEMPGDSQAGCAPYVQFAAFGGGAMVRVELSGNRYLAPQFRLEPAQVAELELRGWRGGDEESPNWFIEVSVEKVGRAARKVTKALRHQFGVPHPQLLSYNAWGPAAENAHVLGLAHTEEVPADVVDEVEAPTKEVANYPDDADQLVEVVAADLRSWLETAPTVDDDGDFVLEHLGQPVWVRVRKDMPAIEVMARVVHGVRSRRATAVELGLLNRDHAWVKWTLRERDVWQTAMVFAWPFATEHLRHAIATFLEDMTATRDDLALRTGGQVA